MTAWQRHEYGGLSEKQADARDRFCKWWRDTHKTVRGAFTPGQEVTLLDGTVVTFVRYDEYHDGHAGRVYYTREGVTQKDGKTPRLLQCVPTQFLERAGVPHRPWGDWRPGVRESLSEIDDEVE